MRPFLRIDLNDPEFKKRKFGLTRAYLQSKQAQTMYTYWLAERLKNTNITVNCICVPFVQADKKKYSDSPFIKRQFYLLANKLALPVEEMAEVYAYFATSNNVSKETGKCPVISGMRYAPVQLSIGRKGRTVGTDHDKRVL